MNRWNKVVYDYHLKQHPLQNRISADNHDMVYDLIHSVYNGVEPKTDNLDKITNSQGFKLASASRRGRIDKTLNFVNECLSDIESLNTDDDKVGEFDQNQARIDNLFMGKPFKSRIDELNDAERKAEWICGASMNEGIDGDEEEHENRSELTQQILSNKHVAKIVDLFGAIYSHMSQVSRMKLFPDPTNILDVETGSDIDHLLQDELIKFAMPELEGLAMAQYATKSLLQYKTGRERDAAKGGVIISIDRSGSMHAEDGRDKITRLDMSVATALAIAKTMDRLGRDWKVLTFHRRTQEVKADSIKQLFDQLIKLTPAGGTEISSNLKQIYGYVDLSEDDVLLITDAADTFSTSVREELVKMKEDVGARLYTVQIGTVYSGWLTNEFSDGGLTANTMEDMKQFSEFALRRK